MTILLGIVAFFFFILFHELGHFIAAKCLGMRVLVFSVGLGTRIIERRIGNTIYALSILPLGGYVRILQKQKNSEPSKERGRAAQLLIPQTHIEKNLEKELSNDGYNIDKLPTSKLSIFLLAGPFANFLLAFLFCWGFHIVEPFNKYPDVLSIDVQESSPALAAGLKTGDIFIKVNGESVATWEEFINVFKEPAEKGSTIKYHVYRPSDKTYLSMDITPQTRVTEEFSRKKRWWYGYIPTHEEVQRGIGKAFIDSVAAMARVLGGISSGIITNTVGFFIATEAPDSTADSEVAGRLNSGGLAEAVTTISSQANQGLSQFFFVCVLYNLVLCFFNLIPFPALDGGMLASILLHKYFPRVVTEARLGFVNKTALVGLLSFSIFILVREAFYFIGYLGI